MRMEDLKYLLEIEHCRSINKAAQNLFLSHSSLSYTLQNIERELGYQIFTRSKQGVIPTPKGTEVLNGCQIILDLIERWHDYSDHPQEIKGHVQITSIPIFSRILGLDMLLRLRKEYPGLSVHFEEKKLFKLEDLLPLLARMPSRILVGSLSDPELTVFQHKFNSDKDWSFYLARGDTLALHISSQNPLSRREFLYSDELTELPLLFYPDSGGQFGYSSVLRHFASVQPYNISTAELVLDMVAENLIVSLASRLVTARSSAIQSGTVRCVPIKGFDMPMNYYVLYPSDANISPAERVIVKGLQQCFDSIKTTLDSVPVFLDSEQ
jgi:DNA-binding transcriptional LysR family regulator